ncbi:MAG: universal stress protein [Rhodobacteraceae bacterium]|nr:MAG: universal stress protein [Paracoccaceae bacterium]
MYSHLLVTVAYDEGHDAVPSLEIARALAEPGAQITLIHVMEPAPVFALSYLPEGWREEMRSAIETDLTEIAQGFDQAAVVVVEGNAAQEILDFANLQGVDCIVIASHRPGSQGLILGSTASKVVARAQCAVHVARRG